MGAADDEGNGRSVPLVPRPAATVLLVRDGESRDASLEVLMVRRNLRSDFVGGAYVFPGGAVEPDDGCDEMATHCDGPTEATASRHLGLAAGGLGYWVAAIRECFEEAGLLLGRLAGSEIVSFADPVVAERFARHRLGLNGGSTRLLDICQAENLRLATDRLFYFAHWITPEGAVRRYDTRFFVAEAPRGQAPAHDAGETIAEVWLRPQDALALHREGAIDLVLPTVHSLRAISRFPDATSLLDAAARTVEVPAVLPRMVADAGGVRLLLPGDPGYSDAPPAPPAADFDAAVRAASLAASAGPDPAGDPAPDPSGGRRRGPLAARG